MIARRGDQSLNGNEKFGQEQCNKNATMGCVVVWPRFLFIEKGKTVHVSADGHVSTSFDGFGREPAMAECEQGRSRIYNVLSGTVREQH